MVLDDFTPCSSWPPVLEGRVDVLRQRWLTDDRFRVSPREQTPHRLAVPRAPRPARPSGAGLDAAAYGPDRRRLGGAPHPHRLAAVLGAGLTNLVYCRPGTHVTEILPANLMSPAYYRLADAVGLDHHLVRGTEPALPRPLCFPDTESDVVADLETLDDVLATPAP